MPDTSSHAWQGAARVRRADPQDAMSPRHSPSPFYASTRVRLACVAGTTSPRGEGRPSTELSCSFAGTVHEGDRHTTGAHGVLWY